MPRLSSPATTRPGLDHRTRSVASHVLPPLARARSGLEPTQTPPCVRFDPRAAAGADRIAATESPCGTQGPGKVVILGVSWGDTPARV